MSDSILKMRLGEVRSLADLQGESSMIARLLDLGFHQGVEIELIQRMPLGGPIIFRVESSLLALREEEALCLKID
jgi:ferrous iron transport protein A